MKKSFRVLCIAAAGASLLFVVLDDIFWTSSTLQLSVRAFRFLHGLLSAAMHVVVSRPLEQEEDSARLRLYALLGVNLLVGAVSIRQANAIGGLHDIVVLHQAFLVANVVTLAVTFLLQWDRRDSNRALDDVISAKYRYKSL